MEPNSNRTVLAWALGVPFFLMPVSLTVDAPDIYGGYGTHVVQLLWFTAIGCGCGLLDVHGAGWITAVRGRPRWMAMLGPLAWLAGSAAVAMTVGMLTGATARPLGRVLGAMSMIPARAWPPPRPSWWVAGAVLLPALRLAIGRHHPTSTVRALALVAGVAQAGAWVLANQFTVQQVPVPALLGLSVLASLLWPWLRGTGRIGDGVAWGVLAGALFVPCAAVIGGLLIPWAPQTGDGAARALAVVGGVGAAGSLTWSLRAVIARLPPADAGAVAAGVGVLRCAKWAPLWAALVVFGLVASVVAMLGAGVLLELSGALSPADPRAVGLPVPPLPIYLPWLALLLGLGHRARTLGGLRALLAGVSGGGAALVVGQLAGLLGAPWLWLLVGAALVGLLIVLRRNRLSLLPMRALTLATPLVLSPVVARYLVSIRVGGDVPLLLVVLLGLALALPWVRAIPTGPADTPVRPRSLATTLPLLAVALILPIYIAVHAGLRPGSFFASVALLVLAMGLSRAWGRPLPWTVAVWLLFYAGFVQTAWFKLGPNAAECREILANTDATVLIDRHGEGGDYSSAYPYDAVPLPGRSTVLASFKRIDKRGGFLEVIDPAAPAVRARTVVRRDGAGGPLWPERIVTDPRTGNAMVQIIGVGAHALWELIPHGDPEAVESVTRGRTLELGYEPGNPAVDVQRRTLAMTYVPNRGQSNPLLEVFDLDTFASRGETRQPRFLQMSDFVETDPTSGRHYAPTLYDFLRFAVVEVLPDLRLGRHWETFHPVIGLAADPGAGRLYVTNPLAGVMEVLDLETFTVVQTLPIGRFPRDVAHDPARNRLYVANYGDGSVVTLSTEGGVLQEVGRVDVGWLLRGLGVDADSGVAVAASGCGVFVIPP